MAAPANHVRRIIKWTALSAAAALAVTGCTSGDGGAGNGSDTGPGIGRRLAGGAMIRETQRAGGSRSRMSGAYFS